MLAMLERFRTGDSGATSIEYALIATMISIVAVAAMTTIGTTTNSNFSMIIPGLN